MHTASFQGRLVGNLVSRDIRSRYQGSFLGIFWALLNPLFLLAMYTFVFSVIFRARWTPPADAGSIAAPTEQAETFGYALILFCGLILHAFLADIISAAPRLIMSNKNYVKRVVFPLQVLPIVTTGSAVFHFAIKFVVLFCFVLFINGRVGLPALMAPFIFLPLVLMGLGIALIMSSLGVFLRDLNQITAPLLTGLLFLGPILYPVSAVPEPLRPLMHLNPLSVPVTAMRDVLIFGIWPDWIALGVYTLVACAVLYLGWLWFKLTKHGFADVI